MDTLPSLTLEQFIPILFGLGAIVLATAVLTLRRVSHIFTDRVASTAKIQTEQAALILKIATDAQTERIKLHDRLTESEIRHAQERLEDEQRRSQADAAHTELIGRLTERVETLQAQLNSSTETNAEKTRQIEKMQSQLAHAQQQIAGYIELEKKVRVLEEQLVTMRGQINKMEEDLLTISIERDNALKQLAEAREANQALQNENETLKRELTKLKEEKPND